MSDDDSSIEMAFVECPNNGTIKNEADYAVEMEEGEEEVKDTNKECVVIDEADEEEEVDEGQYHDPMDLLELLETRPSEENVDSTSNGNVDETRKMERFLAIHEWAFHDEDNKGYIYCLYCDVRLKATASNSFAKHRNSVTHRDRNQEYLDFLNSINDDVYRVKSNIGVERDYDVKAERKSLNEDFKVYIWELWMEKHQWLVRRHEENFNGFCKYCRCIVNPINSFYRRQHEDSAKHKENQRKGPKRRATVSGELHGIQNENSASDEEVMDVMDLEKEIAEIEASNSKWYEKSKSSTDLCRCKLCDLTMFIASYRRHTLSNLHKQNIAAIVNPGVSEKLEKPDWLSVQKEHPWLIENPEDPMEAYCKYCKKQVTYGTSAAKRLIHEQSALHRQAVLNSGEAPISNGSGNESSNDHNDDNYEEHRSDDEEKENVECTAMEEGRDISQNTSERNNISVIEMLKARYPWAKAYKKDSRYIVCQYCRVLLRTRNFNGKKHEVSFRHCEGEKEHLDRLGWKLSNISDPGRKYPKNNSSYPWVVKLNSNDYVFCKYCRFRFSYKASRAHHEKTVRHREAEKAYLEKQAMLNQPPSNDSEASVTTSDTKVFPQTESKLPSPKRKTPQVTQTQMKKLKMDWQNRFVWLRDDKKSLPNYGYCDYCRKSVFVPSIRFAIKHQRASNHIRARSVFHCKEKGSGKTEQTDPSDGTMSESSSKTSAEPAAKKFKHSSLHTAIATAKRLTRAHMDMLNFMRNFAREKPHSTSTNQRNRTTVRSMLECLTPRPMLPPASPSVDSNSALISMNRDPFDLFFTSMSESVKRLPADLASEGKLKVMQIIFDLEIRAQQRQTPNNSLNGSMMNSMENDSLLNENHDLETESNQPDGVVNGDYTNHMNSLPSNQKLTNSKQRHSMPYNAVQGVKSSAQHVNRRITVNNSSTTMSTSQAHTGNTRMVNGQNNSPSNVPSIRTVPLSALTMRQMLESNGIPHIQLNSSTQTRIIPLDSNNYDSTM